MIETNKPFNFEKSLPKGLVFAKPIEQDVYLPEALNAATLITRKWNGWRSIITVTPGDDGVLSPEIRMYTDGVGRRIDNHLPHVVADLKKLQLPPWTALTAEVISKKGEYEDLGIAGGIMNTKNHHEAIAKQDQLGRLQLILHGILCLNDKWQIDTPYNQVLDKLHQLCPQTNKSDLWVSSLQAEDEDFTSIKKRLEDTSQTQDSTWEGLVLYRPDYQFCWARGEKTPPIPRPDGAYKWKPILDGDFIIGEYRMSVKRPGKVKDVMLLQHELTPEGKLFNCGRVGKFDAEMDDFLQSHRNDRLVMEFQFNTRTRAGKIINPKFVRIREDKLPEHCVSGRVYDEAEYSN